MIRADVWRYRDNVRTPRPKELNKALLLYGTWAAWFAMAIVHGRKSPLMDIGVHVARKRQQWIHEGIGRGMGRRYGK